jgi:hypothetical protein
MILALLFVPGLVLTIVGASIALYGRLAIPKAEVAEGSVTRIFTRTARDVEGKVTRDWVTVAFVSKADNASTLDAEVFSTSFLSTGDKVEVWYDPQKPARARLSAGFFAEPYAVVFLVLFGAFWLSLPVGLIFLLRRARG